MIGFYAYHADHRGRYGDNWRWDEQGWLEPGRWHLIEQEIKLNHPERADGQLRAWVDGRLVYENTALRVRNNDSLKVRKVWMNVYYGGRTPSARDLFLDFDDLWIGLERP